MTFLQANGLDPQALDLEALLTAFREDMDRGLAGKGPLPMLPAGFPLRAKIPTDCTLPAFDVGGTNVRSARIRFDARGQASVESIRRGQMPGASGRVDATAFYAALCDILAPNLRAGEAFGYCFSYPIDAEGKLLFWTKHIDAPEIVGTSVVQGLEAALAARGLPQTSGIVLNDTVAALLAAYTHPMTEPCAGSVGFILGTGTNTAYAERAERITKAPHLPKGCLIPINCESGNFHRFPRSTFDDRYEQATPSHGHAQWERCISGAHLGALGTHLLHAAAEAGHFSPTLREALLARTFDTIELSALCAGEATTGLELSTREAETLTELLTPLYARAARFTAINIAAAALHAAEAQGARDGTIRINADGSTLWKTACVPFLDWIRRDLDALLKSRGFDYTIIRIDEAPLIGAAMAVPEQ